MDQATLAGSTLCRTATAAVCSRKVPTAGASSARMRPRPYERSRCLLTVEQREHHMLVQKPGRPPA